MNALRCKDADPGNTSTAKQSAQPSKRRVVAVAHGAGAVVPAGALRLEGQVLDDKERPAADASVVLQPGDVHTKTEGDGSFAFDALPGRYYLYADSGELYSPRASVQLDSATEPVILRMIHGTTLLVHVLSDEQPIAGAQVTLDYADPVATDANGVARFKGRWPGSFTASASAAGYAMQYSRVEIEADPGGVVEQTIRLSRGAPLSGSVVDESGIPVAEATLDIENLDDRQTLHSTSDSHGQWHVDAVAAGRYHISAKSNRYGPTVASPIELDGKTGRSGVVVRVMSGASVFGRVVDTDGKPIEGVEIELQQGARVDQFSDRSDVNGHYEIRGLPAGTYLVLRLIGDRMPILRSVTLEDRQRLALDIVVDDDHVDGTVVDAKGAPIAGAWVSGDGGQSQDVTDSRGHFELTLRKGNRHELAARLHYRDSHAPEPDARVDGSARGVRLVLSTSTGAISGRVLLDGKPVSAYALLVVPLPDAREDNAGTSVHAADGRFVKRDVRAGRWKVTVAAAGCDLADATDVLVEPGKTVDVGDLNLKRGRRITGHVVDASGTGVPGAHVTIGYPSESDSLVRTLLEGRAETITDSSGAYAFDGISRSSIYPRRPMRASHPKFGISPDEHELTDAETTVDFVLSPTGGIDGVVDGFLGDQTYLAARREDGQGGGQAAINRAGEFHFDGLLPGTYTIHEDMESESRRVRPFKATVVAFQRTQVHATLEMNTVTVLARVVSSPCNEVVTLTATGERGDQVASVACSGSVTTIPYIVPGEYRACDWSQRCTSVAIAPSPATQNIEIRLQNGGSAGN